MSQYYYYCELCDHGSQQKSHNDAHIKSNLHIQKCNVFKCNVLEKTDILSLINEYKVPLTGTIHDIYNNINADFNLRDDRWVKIAQKLRQFRKPICQKVLN